MVVDSATSFIGRETRKTVAALVVKGVEGVAEGRESKLAIVALRREWGTKTITKASRPPRSEEQQR